MCVCLFVCDCVYVSVCMYLIIQVCGSVVCVALGGEWICM